MLKRIIMSLTAVMFLLGAGSSFAFTLNSAGLWYGVTTKENVISLYGKPMHVDKVASGMDKYIYEKDGIRLEISLFNDIVWTSYESHDNN
jgi:hypothetical protein